MITTVSTLRPHSVQQARSRERSVREHLEWLLASARFDASERSREFLRFVVDEVLAGRGEELTQATIASRVFGRTGTFDPVLDPIVRVQAGRLRRSLERFYLLAGDSVSMRIELPKGSYAALFVPTAAALLGEPTVTRAVLAEVAPPPVTLVVNPFSVARGEHDAIAQRLKDELMVELYRYGDIRVVRQRDLERLAISRQSVRFELFGSVRRDQDDWQISVRLVDRTTGEQVWSEEYHTSPTADRWASRIDDVARVITARVGAENGVIVRLLTGELANRREAPNGSHGAILRCHHYFLSRRFDETVETIQALERVTREEPEVALAWTYLGRLYEINHTFELSTLETPIDKAINCAYQAMLLDPTGVRARCILASALLVKGEIKAAQNELLQALRLNPESLVYREIIGWLLALSGEWERGMAVMRDAMDRNPYCLPHVQHGLWADYLRRDQIEEAYVAALEYRDSAFFWRDMMRASCLGLLGRYDEARASAAEVLRLKPDFPKRAGTLIGYYVKPADLRERVMEGLRKAGLPVR